MRQSHGFTFIELLIAAAVIAILAVISAAAFKNFGDFAALRTTREGVTGTFADARNRTLASESDARYGVHIDTGEVVRFRGTAYSSTSPENVTYRFPGSVTATSSLTDGAVDVVFGRLTGEASATGTITLTAADGASTTLTVYGSGVIE